MAKNAKFLEMGPANIYLFVLPQAKLLVADHVFVKALRGGAGNGDDIGGNDITVTVVDTGTLGIVVDGFAITINVDGGVTTADQVILALQSGEAAALVTAARKAGENGTDVISAASVANLADGSDVATPRDVGFLGEGVAYQVTTEANPLTGAQTGNVPQNKVVVGGMVKVVIPFKEISIDNFRAGVPSARLVENSDGSRRRVDFSVAVGSDLRSQAIKVKIAKIKGGFESPLPKDQIIIPECSPAEGEVNFPFAPTTQREIMTNWYAWPNPDTGRWAFTGDENP